MTTAEFTTIEQVVDAATKAGRPFERTTSGGVFLADAKLIVGLSADDSTLFQDALRLNAGHVIVLPEGSAWLTDKTGLTP